MQVLIVWWCHNLSMDEIHPMEGYNWKQLSIVFVDVISNWNGGKWLLLWRWHMAIIFNYIFIFNLSIVGKTIVVGRVIFMNCNCSWAQKGVFYYCLALKKNYIPNGRTGLRAFVQNSCAQERC
jgi:hypothetical protein